MVKWRLTIFLPAPPESLDDLAEWVLDKFQHVPNKNIKIPVFEGHPLTESELMVSKENSLVIEWLIPNQHCQNLLTTYCRNKCLSCLSKTIGLWTLHFLSHISIHTFGYKWVPSWWFYSVICDTNRGLCYWFAAWTLSVPSSWTRRCRLYSLLSEEERLGKLP